MKTEKFRKITAGLCWIAAMIALGAIQPGTGFAQEAPRTYWKYLSGSQALPLIYESISGNSNPFDPTHAVQANTTFDATMELAGYSMTFPLFDRTAVATAFLTVGRLSSDVTAGLTTARESTNGFGDPLLDLDVNIIGPQAQRSIPDMMRYEPGFSLDMLIDLAFPIGEYDSSKTLNIGQNRWYGRVGAPIVWQLGAWVPGRRTTLEFVPAIWLFGANSNFSGGKTLETDPMYQFDVHLTRDLYERAWASLDAYSLTGGQASVNGISGEKLNNKSLGFTLGFQINDNMNLSLNYKSTIQDSAPEALRMDMFMVTLVTGWHPIIEGAKRLQGDK